MDLVGYQCHYRSIVASVLGANDERSAVLSRSHLSMDPVPSDGLAGDHRFVVVLSVNEIKRFVGRLILTLLLSGIM